MQASETIRSVTYSNPYGSRFRDWEADNEIAAFESDMDWIVNNLEQDIACRIGDSDPRAGFVLDFIHRLVTLNHAYRVARSWSDKQAAYRKAFPIIAAIDDLLAEYARNYPQPKAHTFPSDWSGVWNCLNDARYYAAE